MGLKASSDESIVTSSINLVFKLLGLLRLTKVIISISFTLLASYRYTFPKEMFGSLIYLLTV